MFCCSFAISSLDFWGFKLALNFVYQIITLTIAMFCIFVNLEPENELLLTVKWIS